MDYDIFLSYSHLDRLIALELEDKLRTNGLSCFMSEKGIGAGSKWLPQIRDSIKSSKRIMVLITPRSISSKWILLETGAAWMENKEIIPLLQFIDPAEIDDVAKNHQSRIIETESQKLELIHELLQKETGKNPEKITFPVLLEKIQYAGSQMANRMRFTPDIFIGSGRAGAICAGIFGNHFGHKPIKVVDCHFVGSGDKRKTLIDDCSICPCSSKDIFGKNILIVEWERQTGKTYKIIEEKLLNHGPAEIQSYAFFWKEGVCGVPGYYSYSGDTAPVPPWE